MGSAASRSRNVTVVDPRGHQVVKDVSFEARAGEVLGIAGVQGNGQTELIKSLLGLVQPDAGTVIRSTARTSPSTGPASSLDAGIGYIPEDRSHDGFVGAFSVRENLVLDLYRRDEFAARPGARGSTRSRPTRSAHRGVRHPHRDHARRRSRRCPAATSRRSSSPGSSAGR